MTDFENYEEKDEKAEDLMENDEVSPEEEGFLKGYDEDESEDEETEEKSEDEEETEF